MINYEANEDVNNEYESVISLDQRINQILNVPVGNSMDSTVSNVGNVGNLVGTFNTVGSNGNFVNTLNTAEASGNNSNMNLNMAMAMNSSNSNGSGGASVVQASSQGKYNIGYFVYILCIFNLIFKFLLIT